MIANVITGKRITGVPVDPVPTLLWTNPSPTSATNGFTANFDGSGYTGFIIKCKYSYGADTPFSYTYVSVGDTEKVSAGAYIMIATSPYTRRIVSVSETGIEFGISYTGPGGGTSANFAIPTHIWGVNIAFES